MLLSLCLSLLAPSMGEEPLVRHSQVVRTRLEGKPLSYFIESKRGPKLNEKCEDGLFFNSHYLLVVDGASDKSGFDYDGHTGGWICKETVLSVFRELQGQESPAEILSEVNDGLRKAYEKYGVDYLGTPERRFSGVMVWYNFDSNSLHALGDCKARIDGKLYNAEEKGVDQLNSEFRVRVLESLGVDTKKPVARDLGREYIKPLLKFQSRYQNNPEAPEGLQYWVIDGTDVPAEKIRTWKFESTPKTLELSSDGYAEFPESSTVEAYEEQLRSLLAEDPGLTWRVKSTKGLKKGNVSFDDRAILIYQR